MRDCEGFYKTPIQMESTWLSLCVLLCLLDLVDLPKVLYHVFEEVLSLQRLKSFAWMAILDKIYTRLVLFRRDILPASHALYPFCSSAKESVDHEWIHCCFSWKVWAMFIFWFGIDWCVPLSLADFYHQWEIFVQGKFQRQSE